MKLNSEKVEPLSINKIELIISINFKVRIPPVY